MYKKMYCFESDVIIFNRAVESFMRDYYHVNYVKYITDLCVVALDVSLLRSYSGTVAGRNWQCRVTGLITILIILRQEYMKAALPQITLLAVLLINLSTSLIHSDRNFKASLVATTVLVALTYWGGFFAPLFDLLIHT